MGASVKKNIRETFMYLQVEGLGPHKKKILFCFMQTENQSNGGVISLLNIACSLAKFTPVFLTQRRSRRTDDMLRSGYSVIFIDRFSSSKNPLLNLLWILQWNLAVFNLIRKNKFTAIHANDNQMVWRSIFAAKLLNVTFVASIRGVFEPNINYGLSRVWVNYCNNIVVMSNEMRNELLDRLPFFSKGRGRNRMRVIGSIISDDVYNFDSSAVKVKENGFAGNVLIVAAFTALKNQKKFLQETAEWFKKNNIGLHFVGDYDPDKNLYANECQAAVKKSGAGSHIFFHGFKEDMGAYYSKADVTLVVSRREGLARCMIESLACGTPVISFDVCSAREILLSNNCGLVVKQGDYQGICNAVCSLIHDGVKLNQMSVNAKATARKLFDKQEIIRQYEDVYQS
jgi:glycosyltransferase involved in cell wall biosynthesis